MGKKSVQKKSMGRPEIDTEGENSNDDVSTPEASTSASNVDAPMDTEKEASLENILSAIKEFRQDNQRQLGEIKAEINKSNIRLDQAEGRIEEAETRIQNVETVVGELVQLQEQLSDRLTDQENRSRRQNIRLFGIPEGSEDNSTMTAFLEELFKSQLQLDPSTDLQIERAHRALVPKPTDPKKPRSIVVKFAKYATKEQILRLTWAKKGLTLQGKRINVDNDYAPDTIRDRKKYTEVRGVLKANHIPFRSLFPAKLRVSYNDGIKTYNSAEEATKDMATRNLPVTVINPPGSLMERLQRLSWVTVAGKRGRPGQQRAASTYKEKLQPFRRSPSDET